MIFTWSLLKVWVMQDTGSRMGNRTESGGSRRNYSFEYSFEHCMDSLLISLLVWWIFQWGTKKRKCFHLWLFLPCYKASLPLWRSGSWLVASPLCLLPVSSPGHTLPRQNLSLNQDLYARLFSFWSLLPTALIFITCAMQPAPFFLLMWHWKYKFKLLCPQSLGEGLPGKFKKSSEIL